MAEQDWFAANAPQTAAPDDWFAANAPQPQGFDNAVLYDPNRKPVSAEDFTRSSGWPAKIGDVIKGFAKGAAHAAIDLGETAGKMPNIFNPTMPTLAGSVDEMYGKPGLSESANAAAREDTAYANNAQRVGGALETVAELAIPVGEGVKAGVAAIPSAERAASKFQQVMSAARNIPIDVNAPGEVALRIQQLADRGGSMPMAVNKFLRRITDPDKAEMAYEEARDFASNISRLSANEYQRLSPAIAREVAGLRVALNKAVAEAANKAGKGREYAEAMTEYARAKRLQGVYEDFINAAKKGAPWATAAAAGGYLGSKLRALIPE